MKDAQISFHCFRVSNSLENGRALESLIRVIFRDRLDARMRSGVRLDGLRRVRAANGLRKWFLEFTRIRDTHGPGKTGYGTPVEDLDLGENEYFGEETMALFLPDSGHLILQYNHYGVRAGAMQEYFSEYLAGENNLYEFNVMLDGTAELRFRAHAETRRITLGVDLQKLTAANRAAGDALTEMVVDAERYGALNVMITMSVGRSKRAALNGGVREAIANFLARAGGAVTSAEVTGRRGANESFEVIDLINHKLVHPEIITPTRSRRLPRRELERALDRARTQWAARLR